MEVNVFTLFRFAVCSSIHETYREISSIMFPTGIEYETNSVCALVFRCKDGAEIGNGIFDCPSGHEGARLDPKDHYNLPA